LAEAEKIALKILRQVMEERLTSSNVEIVTVTPIALPDGKTFSIKHFENNEFLAHNGGKIDRLTNAELEALVREL
jgi:hypothetical protein